MWWLREAELERSYGDRDIGLMSDEGSIGNGGGGASCGVEKPRSFTHLFPMVSQQSSHKDKQRKRTCDIRLLHLFSEYYQGHDVTHS